MRKVKVLLVATGLVFGTLTIAASPAQAVVCHDYPGGCCEGITILGKTYDPLPYECMG
ncbi:MAG: hypothetical protein M3285_05440 [Actinomycetota bacterium]|nr:hypothetical protein [Actinomycetota bacterium]